MPSGEVGLDGHRRMSADDIRTNVWPIAGAGEELEGAGVAV